MMLGGAKGIGPKQRGPPCDLEEVRAAHLFELGELLQQLERSRRLGAVCSPARGTMIARALRDPATLTWFTLGPTLAHSPTTRSQLVRVARLG